MYIAPPPPCTRCQSTVAASARRLGPPPVAAVRVSPSRTLGTHLRARIDERRAINDDLAVGTAVKDVDRAAKSLLTQPMSRAHAR